MADYIWGTGYPQYLQNKAFVKDVTAAMRSAARETAGAIGDSTRSILVAQSQATDRLVKAQMEATQFDGGRPGTRCGHHRRPALVLPVGLLPDAGRHWRHERLLAVAHPGREDTGADRGLRTVRDRA